MSDVAASGLLDNARTLRWLLGHTGEAKALVALYAAFEQAVDLVSRWDIVKQAGDIIVGIIDTFPKAGEAAVIALSDLQSQAVATGVDWDKLFAAAEKFLPIILDFVLKLVG